MKTMVECPGCGKLVEKDDGWIVLACADCIRKWAENQSASTDEKVSDGNQK